MPERRVARAPGKAAVHELVARTAGSEVVAGSPVRLRHPPPEWREKRPVPSARQGHCLSRAGFGRQRGGFVRQAPPNRQRECTFNGAARLRKRRNIAANLGFEPRKRNDPRDRGPRALRRSRSGEMSRIPANGSGREGGSSGHLETITRASTQAPRCMRFDAKATAKAITIAPRRLAATDVRLGERTEHETKPARPAPRPDPSPDGSKRRCRRNSRRDPHATVRLLDVVVQSGFSGALYGARRGTGSSFGSGFARSGQGQRVLASAAPRKATRPAWKPASRVGSPMRSRFVGHGRARASAPVKEVLRHRRHEGKESYRGMRHDPEEA